MGGWGFGGGIFGFERTDGRARVGDFCFCSRWGYLGWVGFLLLVNNDVVPVMGF